MKLRSPKNLLAPAAIVAAVLLGSAGPAGADIELSLEANRAERGNIGYVDMETLFKKFPETVRAKKKFEEDLQKAEDRINLEKIEILHMRQALSQLRMEKKSAEEAPLASSVAPPPQIAASTFSAPSKPAVAAAPLAAPISSSAPVAALPSAAPKASSAQLPLDRSLVSALPGLDRTAPGRQELPVSTASKNGAAVSMGPFLPVSTSTVAAKPPAIHGGVGGVAVSSSSAIRPVLPVLAAAAPPQAAPLLASFTLSSAALARLNDQIASLKKQLENKQADLKQDEATTEKNLLDLESRETESLLGKIYKVIRDVASEAGVSVVVDKSNILYGHDAVDLTGKVLKRLEILKESGGLDE